MALGEVGDYLVFSTRRFPKQRAGEGCFGHFIPQFGSCKAELPTRIGGKTAR